MGGISCECCRQQNIGTLELPTHARNKGTLDRVLWCCALCTFSVLLPSLHSCCIITGGTDWNSYKAHVTCLSCDHLCHSWYQMIYGDSWIAGKQSRKSCQPFFVFCSLRQKRSSHSLMWSVHQEVDGYYLHWSWLHYRCSFWTNIMVIKVINVITSINHCT